jgi:hypothetical protein
MGAMAERRWARITDSVADILRRGAWYPILEETADGQVVVDVREGLQVRLKLDDVTVRDEPPSRWSVVVRTGVLRPTLGGAKSSDLVMTYAVCPACHERQDFEGKPSKLKCTRCNRTAEVDWSATC